MKFFEITRDFTCKLVSVCCYVFVPRITNKLSSYEEKSQIYMQGNMLIVMHL